MRVAVSCLHVRQERFGVDNSILGLVEGLASTASSTDEVVTYGARRAVAARDQSPSRIRALGPASPWRSRWLRFGYEQVFVPLYNSGEAVDLFHAPAYVAPIGTSRPFVVSVHDVFTAVHPGYCKALNRFHHRLLLGRSIRGAARVVVPSKRVASDVRRTFGVAAEKVAVVPPGVEPEFRIAVGEAERRRLCRSLDLSDPFVLWVGNLEPKKNIPNLLAGFRLARRRGLRAKLVLTGGRGWGSTRPSAFDDRDVRWLGFVRREELPLLYQSAAMLVLPSISEGYGLPVLEAMASRIPVVASTAVPAALELDPHASLLVDPESPASIADAMLRVEQDQALRAELVRAAESASAARTWTSHGRAMWSIYRDVVR